MNIFRILLERIFLHIFRLRHYMWTSECFSRRIAPGTTRKPVLETTMLAYIKTYLSDTRGATMIEYGLIAALVAVVLIVALTALGTGLGDMFNNVTDELG